MDVHITEVYGVRIPANERCRMTFKLCVLSGKGGVGKTTVAAAISVHLAEKLKVMAVDADVECPNLHIVLGAGKLAKEREAFSFLPEINEGSCVKCYRCVDACRRNALFRVEGKAPILIEEQCNGCGSCIIACPAGAIRRRKVCVGEIKTGEIKESLHIISGEMKVGNEEPTPVVRELMNVVEEHENDFDFVVVDAPPGVKCNVVAPLETCDAALLVMEPTPLGIEDARRVAELIRLMNKRAFIVVNRALGPKEDLEKIRKIFPFPVIGVVPYSENVVMLYTKGRVNEIEGINSIVAKLDELLKR